MSNPKRQRNVFLVLFILVLLALICTTLSERWYLVRPAEKIPKIQKQRLIDLASQTGVSRDMPISAILTYHDSIIGEGYNTLKRDSDITGHAEINALRQAFKKYGPEGFKKLDRRFLKMISTYEPCLMCKGVLSFYEISDIRFLKHKDFSHWWTDEKRIMHFEMGSAGTGDGEIHDSLFRVFSRN